MCLANSSWIIKCSPFCFLHLLLPLSERKCLGAGGVGAERHRPASFNFLVTSQPRQKASPSPPPSIFLHLSVFFFFRILKFRLWATSANPSLHTSIRPPLLHLLLSLVPPAPRPSTPPKRAIKSQVMFWPRTIGRKWAVLIYLLSIIMGANGKQTSPSA